ncbi:hypothetical protein TNCV_3016151 [Trichonephila clavipes]|nr:hypothetical protein TNCV_3016151 [Trichonephila clavipes]
MLHVPILSRVIMNQKKKKKRKSCKLVIESDFECFCGDDETMRMNALSSFATVMPMRKRRSLGRKTVKSKSLEHTGAAEAPDEKNKTPGRSGPPQSCESS